MNNDLTSEEQAKARFFTINAVRLMGAIFVAAGLLVLQEILPLPGWAGWALVAIGMVDFFAMPMVLARRWRTQEL